jgi:hypothetical protein
MYIYVDEYYNNLNKKKNKISNELIKNTIYNLKKINKNLILSDKMVYFIIYLIKNNCKFKLINRIISKLYSKISNLLSKFLFKSIRKKWKKIIEIAIMNDVELPILNYFFDLYELYIDNKNCDKFEFKKVQAKNIVGINIKNNRQFEKYFKLNIYNTIYYSDIIFSELPLKYLDLNFIFDIKL